MVDLNLTPAKTVLLCLDMHYVTVERVPEPERTQVVQNVRRVLDGARNAGVQVIYASVARRRAFMSPRNRFAGSAVAITDPAILAEKMKIVGEVSPLPDEPVVHKPRISAFHGSELSTLLASRDIDTLVLTGVATNLVVDSTARHAADADYRVIVLEDCCEAFTREEQAAAITGLQRMVEISTSADFLDSLSST
jgi:nicotinamidase-related amidase